MPVKPSKQLNNRGFSLLEVLVAVAVLVLLVLPLLRPFVTSARTAAKSRKLGDATLAAESVAEALTATKLSALTTLSIQGAAPQGFEALSEDTDAYGANLPYGGEGNADIYRFSLNGLHYGKHNFDVAVSLDAASFSLVNSAEITAYSPFDAAFSQPGTLYTNPDWLAADRLANEALARIGAATYQTESDYVLKNMDRVITVDLESHEDAEWTATVTYDYTYRVSYTLTVIDETGAEHSSTHNDVLTDSYSYEFFRDNEIMSNVYLFYYPNYESDALNPDRLVLNNKDDLPVSVFLIKEKAIRRLGTPGAFTGTAEYSDAEIQLFDAAYNAELLQYESVQSKPFATVYSNIAMRITDTLGSTATINKLVYRIFRGSVWYRNGTFDGVLVDTSPQNRMYGVTIQVYDAGSEGEPLYTFHSSKLD